MILAAFLIILGLLFCVCTPRKYDLRVGSISHVTVDATKDVVDKVTTEEKQNAAAEQVVPNLHFKQGVKEEVLASLSGAFQELRAIQQYGLMLRTSRDGELIADRPFSEEEIEYAFSMIDILELNRTQLEIILRSDTDEFEKMIVRTARSCRAKTGYFRSNRVFLERIVQRPFRVWYNTIYFRLGISYDQICM